MRPSARSSSATFGAAPLTLAILLARQRHPAAFEQLLPPVVIERLRDLVLTADLLHGTLTAQAGQHDRELLLGRPAPVLPLLAQPSSSRGRAAHPEPAAGRSLRRYAPPGSSGEPTRSDCQRGTGSGADHCASRVA